LIGRSVSPNAKPPTFLLQSARKASNELIFFLRLRACQLELSNLRHVVLFGVQLVARGLGSIPTHLWVFLARRLAVEILITSPFYQGIFHALVAISAPALPRQVLAFAVKVIIVCAHTFVFASALEVVADVLVAGANQVLLTKTSEKIGDIAFRLARCGGGSHCGCGCGCSCGGRGGQVVNAICNWHAAVVDVGNFNCAGCSAYAAEVNGCVCQWCIRRGLCHCLQHCLVR